MTMFEWLEETSLALWVGESLWGYPMMLSLHAVGLAILVGIFVMRDLRLLGSFDGISYSSLASLVKFAWIGFVINALSGAALFSSQAATFVESTPFLLKIGCIFLAVISAAVIQNRTRNEVESWDAVGVNPPGSIRIVAVVSLTLWISAIVSGRLIAYL